jgi:hypothetical protein
MFSSAACCRYKHQVMLARERFKATLGPEAARLIDINTIDGFQGREKDVAIFTCVRSNPKKGIGFVADFRRMNVGITRARASMLVVGSAAALKRDKHWAALIKHARATDCVFQVTPQQPRLSSGSPALFCFLQSCPERSFLLGRRPAAQMQREGPGSRHLPNLPLPLPPSKVCSLSAPL